MYTQAAISMINNGKGLTPACVSILGRRVRASVCRKQDMEDPQESADRFRAIFDLCDEDKDGFIDVDHFTGLAKDHFGAEGLDVEVSCLFCMCFFSVAVYAH